MVEGGARPPVVATVVTAAVLAVLEILIAVSFATLLFARAAPDHLSLGVGAMLAAAAVQLLVVGCFGSLPGTASSNQDAPVAVLAAVVGTLAVTGDERSAFATILLAVVVSTAVTGVVMLVMGRARLGRLARFVPYPVQAAFLAATGWLLLSGGIEVAAGSGLVQASLGRLGDGRFLVAATATLVVAAVLFAVTRQWDSPLALPVVVAVAVALVHLVALVNGASIAELQAGGWLPAEVSRGVLWRPEVLTVLPEADVGDVLRHAGDLLTIPFLAVLGLLIGTAGVELDRRVDIDADRELQVTGAANLAAAAVGGPPGWVAVSLTGVTARTGAPTRLAVAGGGALVLLAVFGGSVAFSRMPLVVVGGLLAYLGVEFLHQYLWVARHTVPGAEYASVVAIMVSVIVGGYAVGLVVGLVFATVRFLVLSGRDDPVRTARTGREVRSRAYRTPEDAAHLREAGDRIRVVHLTGFLFFGTSAQIADGLRTSVLGDHGGCPPRFVVLDLDDVNGVDATAAMGLGRVVQVADAAGAQVVVAGAATDVWRQLEAAGLGEHVPPERRFDTVDAALEHAEDVVLAEAGRHGHVEDPLAPLRSSFSHPATFAVVQECMEQVSCEPGEVVVDAGEHGRDLYVVARGRVRVERGSAARTRVRTLGPGDMLGEGAFYAGRRGAHVRAETDAELHRIDADELERAFATAPEAAADFHRAMARLLSQRLGEANRADGTLLR